MPAPLPDGTVPTRETIPTPTEAYADGDALEDADDVDGAVVWHREHLRTADQPAVAAAADRADVLLPVFVFDPAFYDDDGLACDARIRFLHECLADLDDQYHTASGGVGGLTYAHGDPLEVVEAVLDAGWDVVAARTPSGRYGKQRDDRAREVGVEFVSGDGLVRDTDRPREGWSDRVEAWLTADQYEWDPRTVRIVSLDTGVTIDGIDRRYEVSPSKSMRRTGGTGAARDRLESFVDRIGSYPGNISSPVDARGGTSGLSPYLKFGCLSVRQVYQSVDERVPDGRAKELFVSRLYWNKHYEQKLEDWPGWLDEAVNPVLAGFNRDRYDPDLVTAWKRGQTGYPMVDASMRCLRETGWLNFRMRAMCVSFYYHVLQQPWRVGADWFHHHLVDSVASINYTQWQYQCGLVGKPSLRVYNPRKQVRDQDPDGEFVGEWVPELDDLPAPHLDRPEKTPLAVQRECGVSIGDEPTDDYPFPVVEFEAAKDEFWRRYEAVHPEAAARLGDPAVARRASLSGGRQAARRIAAEHGPDGRPDRAGEAGDATDGSRTQTDLSAFE
jgi:deoxyribodipyrimidine photo-lyase